MPKCMSCRHKAIVVITRRAHCFHDKIYIYIYMLSTIFLIVLMLKIGQWLFPKSSSETPFKFFRFTIALNHLKTHLLLKAVSVQLLQTLIHQNGKYLGQAPIGPKFKISESQQYIPLYTNYIPIYNKYIIITNIYNKIQNFILIIIYKKTITWKVAVTKIWP